MYRTELVNFLDFIERMREERPSTVLSADSLAISPFTIS
jgi:hypothetical protein